MLLQLRDLEVELHMDDFGTGLLLSATAFQLMY